MAANFWTASHAKALLSRKEVLAANARDLAAGLTIDDVKQAKVHFAVYISDIARICRTVRQRVVATAVVYFRRFYTARSFADYDPRHVAPACLYLAAKAEETIVQAKVICGYINKKLRVGADGEPYHIEVKQLLDMEMRVLEELNFLLIIYHPYRPLQMYLESAGISSQLQFCWGLVNDSYRTDLCLIHPPYMIALGVIYTMCVLAENNDKLQWFDTLNVDMDQVMDVALEMLNFYDIARVPIDAAQCNAMLARVTAGPAAPPAPVQ